MLYDNYISFKIFFIIESNYYILIIKNKCFLFIYRCISGYIYCIFGYFLFRISIAGFFRCNRFFGHIIKVSNCIRYLVYRIRNIPESNCIVAFNFKSNLFYIFLFRCKDITFKGLCISCNYLSFFSLTIFRVKNFI